MASESRVPGFPTENVGWIGLGIMGSRMLPHLLAAGLESVVFDVNEAAVDALVDRGAQRAESPGEVAAACDVVFTIVATPADVEAVYFGPDGLLATAHPGAVLVDMTSSSAALARRIESAAEARGIATLDAPVSGGPVGAETASLSIMVGGRIEPFERIRPLLDLLASQVVHHGPAGSGQSAKMANQIAMAGAMIGICEAFLFARAAGLRPPTVLDTISAGIAGSRLTDYIWPRLADGDLEPGFRVEHLIKDLDLALATGHDNGIALPATALVKELYHRVVAAGLTGRGTQALIAALDAGGPTPASSARPGASPTYPGPDGFPADRPILHTVV